MAPALPLGAYIIHGRLLVVYIYIIMYILQLLEIIMTLVSMLFGNVGRIIHTNGAGV